MALNDEIPKGPEAARAHPRRSLLAAEPAMIADRVMTASGTAKR